MKLLLVLNENPPGSHSNVHHSLSNLKGKNVITEYNVYPFPARLAQGLTVKEMLAEIIDTAKVFIPDIILWSHTGEIPVPVEAIDALKNVNPKLVMGYWDGDIYEKPQPLPKELLKLAAFCNVTFCQGQGYFTKMLKKYGSTDIRFVPASSDELRFFKKRPANKKIQYDVVMIGNNVTSRLPWRTAPGSLLRKKIATLFSKKLGDRFAIYGEGWKESFGKGKIGFNDQVNLYHSSRIALGTNNWLGPKYYFSNRLPIAMSSGVPLVYNYEEGFDELFGEGQGIFFFKTPEQAWEICSDLLKKQDNELERIGDKAFAYAFDHLRTEHILDYMIKVLGSLIDQQFYSDSKKNPWVSLDQL
jgi:glycosyltransferase involved in cell wall biosynthesis